MKFSRVTHQGKGKVSRGQAHPHPKGRRS